MTGSIHATRRHSIEIENNIRLLLEACITVEQSNFNSSLYNFLNHIQRANRTVMLDSRSEPIKTHIRVSSHNTDPIALKQIQKSINNNKIELFKTCYVSLYYIMTNKL